MERSLTVLGLILAAVVILAVLLNVFLPVQTVEPEQEEQQQQQPVENDDTICTAATGESMGLAQAKEIALASECGDRIEDSAVCNSVTGTWWIDTSISRPGCSPACVVDIATSEAEINWRCTGLNP